MSQTHSPPTSRSRASLSGGDYPTHTASRLHGEGLPGGLRGAISSWWRAYRTCPSPSLWHVRFAPKPEFCGDSTAAQPERRSPNVQRGQAASLYRPCIRATPDSWAIPGGPLDALDAPLPLSQAACGGQPIGRASGRASGVWTRRRPRPSPSDARPAAHAFAELDGAIGRGGSIILAVGTRPHRERSRPPLLRR